MNTDNGALDFDVYLDNQRLFSMANEAERRIKGLSNSIVMESKKMDQGFSEVGKTLTMIGGTTAITMLGKQIIDTTAKFEKFGIVLKNTLGETQGAEALTMLANFAATTPFQLDEVTASFIKMANQGFVPTRDEMVKLGDLASSTGKSFDQLTEALLDAQTGQFERLKEFGIKASANGDRVTFSFKEQKTTVENTNSAIQAYILSLGELKGVAGANALISESLTGQISNLGDKLDAMYNKVGSSNKGVIYAAVEGAATLVENYELVGEAVGGLIGIYGSYKVATMAVAYMENKRAVDKARNILIEKAMETDLMAIRSMSAASIAARGGEEVLIANARVAATQRVITAEKELAATTAKSSLVNPYVLAAMAVAALGYAIYKLVNYQTDLEKAVVKTNASIENEKDKASELFIALKNVKDGSEEWKKAKQSIIDQYGKYLTPQQQELKNLREIKEAQDQVNKSLTENVAIKDRDEMKTSIREKYNQNIAELQKSIVEGIKKDSGATAAYEMQFKLSDFTARVKAGTASATGDEATALHKEIAKLGGGSIWSSDRFARMIGDLSKMKGELKEADDAYNKFISGITKTPPEPKKDPVKTTYEAQIQALRQRKADLQKELEILKKTPGEDPMKAVIAKQGEIDEINKQLGIKEKVKENEDQIDKTKKALETANGAEREALIKKLVLLEDEKKAHEEILRIQEEIIRNKPLESVGPSTEIGALREMSKSLGLDTESPLKTPGLKEGINYSKKAEELMDKQKEHAKETAGYFYDVADSASYLSQQIGDSNKELAGMLGAVGNIAGQFGKLAENGFKMSKGEGISMAIGGATQLIGMVVGQAAENKRVMKEYYDSIINQQQEYNLLLNDQLRINSDINDSVFLKDYEGSLNDATAAYNDAQKKYNAEYKKFLSSEAIVGKKNVVSGTNVLTGVGAGAALGAGIGSVVPVIGTAIGAVVGGFVGLFTGLFAKKKKNIVAPLLDTYPDLIKKNGEFNADLAKTLVANDRVTDATKKTLQNMIEWKEAADKATEQLKGVISDLTGSLGNDLRSALVDAFENGTDAAKAFEGSVNKVLENIMSNMIFNKAFEGAFKMLEDNMAASYAIGGDQSWLDDFQKFYSESPDLIDQFNKGMEDARKAAAGAGFDIFNGEMSTNSSLSGAIKGASEESVSMLSGYANAIRINQIESIDIMRNQLMNLAEIASNTRYNRYLESIDRRLSTMETGNSLRANGLGN